MTQRVIEWMGAESDLQFRLFRAGAASHATIMARPGEFLGEAPIGPGIWEIGMGRSHQAAHELVGVALPLGLGGRALGSTYLNDGLAQAVGCVDTVSFSSALPQSFGFVAAVSGIVAAVREVGGLERCEVAARVECVGPEAWCAMAALTQLRCTALEVADPLSKAVAHRLGVELASVRDPGIIYSGSASVYSTSGTVRVPSSLIALHTVAAQLRLFLSREPDLASMRQVIDSES